MGKVSIVVLLLFFLGCSYYVPLGKAKESGEVELPEMVYTDEVVVQPKEPPQNETESMSGFEGVSKQEEEILSRGWRVQLTTANDQFEAQKIKDDAERKLGVKVYVQYTAPVYKIRAGDFEDRDSAQALCEKARKAGFPDSYVIPSEIIIRK